MKRLRKSILCQQTHFILFFLIGNINSIKWKMLKILFKNLTRIANFGQIKKAIAIIHRNIPKYDRLGLAAALSG